MNNTISRTDPFKTPLAALTQAELDSLVVAALDRWTATGLTGEQLAALRALKFEVADLPGWYLGEAGGDRIRVDNNAGGNGWFIGSATEHEALFAKEISATRRYTDPASAPAGRIDLLTAILHEMGHALGLDDTYAEQDRDSLMYGFLTKGERRLPAKGQAIGAKPHVEAHTHFLSTPLTIGDLPPGKTVTITYVVQINAGTAATSISSQGTVSGSNFANKVTNDPQTGAADDATVTPIHQPPVVSNVAKSVNEDAANIAFAASEFTPGSYSDPNGDALATVRITSLPSNGVLKNTLATITTVPHDIAIGSIANLNYTPNANYNGSDSFGWNGSDGTLFAVSGATVNITVNAVNDVPSFTKGADQTVLEDAGAQTVNGWASALSAGPANEAAQLLDFIVSNNNNALFSTQPAVAANGTLTYTPAANASGSATVTVQIHDNGGIANGGVDTSAAQTFTVNITPVNDAPTLDPIPDPAAIPANSGAQAVNLSGISAGPGESQTLTVTATSGNTGLIPHPTVAYTSPNAAGSLNYTPVAAQSGSALITVTVTDNGGTANGGVNTTTRTFTVNVTVVAAPEITVSGNSVNITDGDITPDLADHTDFGSTAVAGGTVVRTFTIANSGTADLTLGAFTIGGTEAADFLVTTSPVSPVTPGNSTTFQVTFDPSASGLRSATVSFVNNDTDENPFDFSIQGTGSVAAVPEIAVSGNSANIADSDITPDLADHTDFGSTAVAGGTVVRTFTIANSGTADLTLGAFTIGGPQAAEFVVTASPISPVTPGNSTTFQVTFDPSAGGLRNATVSFVNNDSDENPFDFSIQGTGTVAANAPPVANPDTLVRLNNTRVAKVLKTTLLANDTDADPDTLSITGVGSPLPAGATVVVAGNFVVYTAPTETAGDGSFTYTLSDGAGGHSVTGTVTVDEQPPGTSTSGPNDVKIVPTAVAGGTKFTVYFIGVPGNQYRVQYSSVLPYDWKEFVPPAIYTAPDNTVFSHEDLDLDPPEPMRFYRAVPHVPIP